MLLNSDELRSGSRIVESCVTDVCDKAFVLFIIVLPSFIVCHCLLHFGTTRYVLATGASQLRLLLCLVRDWTSSHFFWTKKWIDPESPVYALTRRRNNAGDRVVLELIRRQYSAYWWDSRVITVLHTFWNSVFILTAVIYKHPGNHTGFLHPHCTSQFLPTYSSATYQGRAAAPFSPQKCIAVRRPVVKTSFTCNIVQTLCLHISRNLATT